MMKAEKILFITQEINPYVAESDLTKLGRDLPNACVEQNREIRAFMPKWGNINERRNQLHPVQRLSGMNLIIDDTDYQLIIKVASIVGTRMQVYFIDDDDFFGKRLAERDREGNEYEDNAARAVFYARSVLETVKKLRWVPDVIHCSGWISAMVPVYLKTAYAEEPCFRDCRVVYSLTDNSLKLSTGENFGQVLEYRNATSECFSEFGKNLKPADVQKLAIKYADGVTLSTRKPQKRLVDYAKQQGKLILDAKVGETSRYVDFFDTVWSEGRKENNDD